MTFLQSFCVLIIRLAVLVFAYVHVFRGAFHTFMSLAGANFSGGLDWYHLIIAITLILETALAVALWISAPWFAGKILPWESDDRSRPPVIPDSRALHALVFVAVGLFFVLTNATQLMSALIWEIDLAGLKTNSSLMEGETPETGYRAFSLTLGLLMMLFAPKWARLLTGFHEKWYQKRDEVGGG